MDAKEHVPRQTTRHIYGCHFRTDGWQSLHLDLGSCKCLFFLFLTRHWYVRVSSMSTSLRDRNACLLNICASYQVHFSGSIAAKHHIRLAEVCVYSLYKIYIIYIWRLNMEAKTVEPRGAVVETIPGQPYVEGQSD